MLSTFVIYFSIFVQGEIVSNPKQAPFQLPTQVTDDQYDNAKQKQAEYITQFGKSLVDSMITEGGNLFVSPYSVHTALMMVANGAENQTKDIFTNVLRLYSLAEGQTPIQQQSILAARAQIDVSGKPFKSANSIWIRDSFRVYDSFISESKLAFDATVELLDFKRPDSVGKINDWVSQNTNGQIKRILERLNPQDEAVLVNTLHFKQPWSKQFEKFNTQPKVFTLNDGKQTECQMMRQTSKFNFAEKNDAKIISLPFKQGTAKMLVILPKASGEKALRDVASRYLDNAWFKEATNSLVWTNVALGLPRFRVEFEKELKDPLTAMGLGHVFSDKATFSRLSPDRVHISTVIHKTVLDVDENGVEAAAATAITMATMASLPDFSFPIPFEVDRPFVVALYDDQSKLVYFSGVIRSVGGKSIGGIDIQEL